MMALQTDALADQLPVSEACLRNQEPILLALMQELKEPMTVLELASGSGQHGAFFAPRMPHIRWQPSELAERIPGINAWRRYAGCDNLLPPLVLDIAQTLWPIKQVDAVFAANLVHFVGWDKLRSMFSGIGRVLNQRGRLFLYGPFKYNDRFNSAGDEALDQWLKERDREAGIRDVAEVMLAARREKLKLIRDIAMPANNRLLVLQKYA